MKKAIESAFPFSFETARYSNIHSLGEERMKFSRLFKIAERACLHKLRGNHALMGFVDRLKNGR